MANRDTNVADLCNELGISRATLYRYVGPDGRNRCSGPTFCLILHSVIESQRMERTEFLHGASNGVSLNGSE